ncbi:hypothetical protein DdX_21611 [Ditylenchus destructor]|uniref:Uncharacterized protein n=1 Tax=Ditylenchus destructor TaxID=166010 RepID=A0AAD4MFG3_9BILA|nr:hypothetical protein DdX_21611 [Ditylenchus destructor]
MRSTVATTEMARRLRPSESFQQLNGFQKLLYFCDRKFTLDRMALPKVREQPNLTADGGARSDDEPNLTLCTLRVDGRAEGAARQLGASSFVRPSLIDWLVVCAPSFPLDSKLELR